MSSPTQRSLKVLRDEGYHVEIVEHWSPWAKRRNDMFGFVDLLAVHKETGDVLAVQTTSGSNMSARVKKITEHENLPIVRKAGWTIHVHGWSRLKNGWTLRVEDLS